jgi:hypothetical protein
MKFPQPVIAAATKLKELIVALGHRKCIVPFFDLLLSCERAVVSTLTCYSSHLVILCVPYLLLHVASWSEADVQMLQSKITAFLQHYVQAFEQPSFSVNFHKLIHLPEHLPLYGAVQNFSVSLVGRVHLFSVIALVTCTILLCECFMGLIPIPHSTSDRLHTLRRCKVTLARST